MADEPLPAIMRPNGKPYRPRKITANAVTDENAALCGVLVLGTHDTARAQPLADEYARWQLGGGWAATEPECGWWRDGYEGTERAWIEDDERGRAGVMFQVAEVAPADLMTGEDAPS